MWVRNKLGMQIPSLFQVWSILGPSLFHLSSHSHFVLGQAWNATRTRLDHNLYSKTVFDDHQPGLGGNRNHYMFQLNSTFVLFQFCSNKIQLKKFRISVAWTHFLAQYPTRYMRVEIWQLHIVKPLKLTSAPRKTHQLVMRTGFTSIPPSIRSDEAPSPTHHQLLWAQRKSEPLVVWTHYLQPEKVTRDWINTCS